MEKLSSVPSDYEDEEELTDMTNEDEYETDDEEEYDQEEENGKDANNNHHNGNQNGAGSSKLTNLKATCVKSSKKSTNQVEEPMEMA